MAGQLTIDTLKASSGVLGTQNGMTGIAKAWVQFTGSTATVNASFNVSLITRTATGQYTVNFTTAMPNANYCVNVNLSPVYGVRYSLSPIMYVSSGATEDAPTTTSFRYGTSDSANNLYDPKYNFVSVFSS